MPKNWKYIKKLLEKEFLCEKLKGYITYDLTDYRPAPLYQQHFIMKFDDEILIEASQPEVMWDKHCEHMALNWHRSFQLAEELHKKYSLDGYGLPQYTLKAITDEAIEKANIINAHHNGIFGVHDVIDAIGIYLHSDINSCLHFAQDELVIAFAVLDRRCGRRRLEKYAACSNHISFPNWLKRIF